MGILYSKKIPMAQKGIKTRSVPAGPQPVAAWDTSNAPRQPSMSQDNRTKAEQLSNIKLTEKINNARVPVLKQPLVYLADPLKIIGDFVAGFNPNRNIFPTTKKDAHRIALSKYFGGRGDIPTNTERGWKEYAPYAALNVGLGAAMAPEANFNSILNESINPLALQEGTINPYVRKVSGTKPGLKIIDKISDAKSSFKAKAKELTEGKFSSQIHWGDWNMEIPANKELMKEYYDIERKAKANGSFMKNPDGSAYKGHEEAWVQEQSKNFKKWYGDSKTLNGAGAPETFYHQSPQVDSFDVFDAREGTRKISGENHPNLIFTTPDANMARSYGSGHRYSLYGKSENPRSIDYAGRPWSGDKKIYRIQSDPNQQGAMYGPGENYSVLDYPSEEAAKKALKGFKGHEYYDNFVITNSYKGNPSRHLSTNNQAQRSLGQKYDSFEADNVLDYGPSVDVKDMTPSKTRVFFNPSNVKSRIKNNGMFDITNPNMYKALAAPIGLGTVLRSTSATKRRGGGILYKK